MYSGNGIMRVRSKHVRSSQRPLNNQEKEPDTFQVFAQRANKEGKRGGKERAARKKKRKEKRRTTKKKKKGQRLISSLLRAGSR